ncbi:MAG TPA: MATE family efflux transporter [Myxococcota bacterium]|nr:MATE family efflux transporter [Myxococcota bacterium]
MQELREVDLGEVEAAAESGGLERPSLLALLRDRDHTRGSLLVSVLVLALPSVLTMMFSFGLSQMVDLSFLGRLGAHALAAATSSDLVLRQGLNLFVMGMTVAAQMMIARNVGAGRLDAAEHVAGQTFLLGACLAAVAALVGISIPHVLARVLSPDAEVVGLATSYVRVVFVMFFAMVAGQMFSTVLNAAGDTTTPLLISFVVTPLAIFGEWSLAFGHAGAPALGLVGLPLGSASAGLIGAAIGLGMLFSGRCRVHLRARNLVPDPAALRRLLRTAVQPSAHMLARSTMLMVFTIMAGRFGEKVQAAYGIGVRIEMLAIMFAFPIANACATLVGQNLGARDLPRAWRAVFTSSAVSLVALLPLAAGVFLFRHPIVNFFAPDPEVAEIAAHYLVYSSIILSFYGLYFIAFRTLQSSGDMNSPMIVSIGTAFLVGAPLGYLLSHQAGLGPTGMWIANLIYALVNASLMIGWLLTGRWTHRHRSV